MGSKEDIYKLKVPTYLVKKIGVDIHVSGEQVLIGNQKLLIIPKYIYLIPNEDINKVIIKKISLDSFSYTDDIEEDKEIKNNISEIELITSYTEKIELVKAKYLLYKGNRENIKYQNEKIIKDLTDSTNFFMALLSLILALFVNYFTSFPLIYTIVSIVLLYLLLERSMRNWLSKRLSNLSDIFDEQILNEEWEDKILCNRAHILTIHWKKGRSTIHIILTKKEYDGWVEHMKTTNKDIPVDNNFISQLMEKYIIHKLNKKSSKK